MIFGKDSEIFDLSENVRKIVTKSKLFFKHFVARNAW